MKCLQNLDRVTCTKEMIMTLIKLYKFHGKEFYYDNLLKKDSNQLIKKTIEMESFFLTKFLNLSLTENRLRLIITNNSEPKTNDEKIVRNIKRIIEVCCNNYHLIEYSEYQIKSIADLLFKDVKKVSYDKHKENDKTDFFSTRDNPSKIEDVLELVQEFNNLVIEEKHEITNLICNFYIDLLNIKPFKEDNEIIAMIILYVFLFKSGFTQFKYVSFFELLFKEKEKFKVTIIEANYNWAEGFSKVEPLNNFIVKLLLENYDRMEEMIRPYLYKFKMSKGDDLKSTILKGPEVFTKAQLRSKHTSFSDSTIQRALDDLKKEGKLKCLGTGRSATWHKVVSDYEGFDIESAEDLFSTLIKNNIDN